MKGEGNGRKEKVGKEKWKKKKRNTGVEVGKERWRKRKRGQTLEGRVNKHYTDEEEGGEGWTRRRECNEKGKKNKLRECKGQTRSVSEIWAK